VSSDSRERMVRSAASLISTRGVSATSFSEVLADSGAPRGSIYHHFPDGKRQLAEDAMRWTSERVLAHQRANAGPTARSALECFIGMWRSVVLSSSGSSGCVVAGVAIDAGGEEQELLPIARDTFREWVALLSAQLTAGGLTAARAHALATTTLAGMEGALILCRTEASVIPLDAVAEELLRLLPDRLFD
jgi:TetR/AcrR family transcriptional repressor of lmrAB and yxaGH operons